MMAPTVALRDGRVELVLGSAGSNRIRSAMLQTMVGAVDHGLRAEAAVSSPRIHVEAAQLYAEPGVRSTRTSASAGRLVRRWRANVFFGGVQAVAQPGHGRADRRGGPPPRRRGRDGLTRACGSGTPGSLRRAW